VVELCTDTVPGLCFLLQFRSQGCWLLAIRALEDEEWACRRGVQLDFIRPGKPVENAFIESLNGRLRDECLTVHQFPSMAEAQDLIEAWRLDDN